MLRPWKRAYRLSLVIRHLACLLHHKAMVPMDNSSVRVLISMDLEISGHNEAQV
jgi:hypothetical protein